MKLKSLKFVLFTNIIGDDPCHNIDIIIDDVENNLPKELIATISVLSIPQVLVRRTRWRQLCHFTQ